MPAALSLFHHYSYLSYFPHALEILLHHALDDEVDNQSKDEKQGDASVSRPLLPSVISFLQATLPLNVYLNIVVQCTRKTELRSWRTLFAYLPPPKELFEHALKLKSLKTAAGYLLVLQALDDELDSSEGLIEDYAVRLLGLASQKEDWDLCGELSRFLIALDVSGDMLRRTISRVGLRSGLRADSDANSSSMNMRGLGLSIPMQLHPSLPTRQVHNLHRKASDISSKTSSGTGGTSPNRAEDMIIEGMPQASSSIDEHPSLPQ